MPASRTNPAVATAPHGVPRGLADVGLVAMTATGVAVPESPGGDGVVGAEAEPGEPVGPPLDADVLGVGVRAGAPRVVVARAVVVRVVAARVVVLDVVDVAVRPLVVPLLVVAAELDVVVAAALGAVGFGGVSPGYTSFPNVHALTSPGFGQSAAAPTLA